MQIIRNATYHDGVLVLDEQLEAEKNGKTFKVYLFENDTNDFRKQSFFESLEKHSFPLPDDYKFNRDELHER